MKHVVLVVLAAAAAVAATAGSAVAEIEELHLAQPDEVSADELLEEFQQFINK
jgi:hypothetical protein